MAAAAEEDDSLVMPIWKDGPEEGTVTFQSDVDITKLEGLFSFTLYTFTNDIEKFQTMSYYQGLKIYIDLVHRQAFFENVGIVIYTIWPVQEMLEKLFVSAVYPKLIFATIRCPRFMVPVHFTYNGKVTRTPMLDESIFRCMRFHAAEAFPHAWICVRDADTYFKNEISTAVFAVKNKYKIRELEKPADESKFFAPKVIDIDSPDPTPLLADRIGKWEQEYIEGWIRQGSPIAMGVNFGYLADWHTEFPIIYPIKDGHQIGKRFNAKELHMQAPYGILAGFCNFSRSRPADLWNRIYMYLDDHYPRVLTSVEGPKNYQLSNASYKDDLFLNYIGKDERILLFAILPYYLESCYFFYIFFDNTDNAAICIKYEDTNPFKCTPLLRDTIDTILLGDGYIKKVYFDKYTLGQFFRLPIVPDLDLIGSPYKIRIDSRAKKIILDNYETVRKLFEATSFTFHEYFYAIFNEFYSRYRPWYSEIMAATPENITRRIDTTLSPLTGANFYEPPRRIPGRGGYRLTASRKRVINRKTRKGRLTPVIK